MSAYVDAVTAQRVADRAWVAYEAARAAQQYCNVGHADYPALAAVTAAALAAYLYAGNRSAEAAQAAREEAAIAEVLGDEVAPPCFDDPAQFAGWVEMYRKSRGHHPGLTASGARSALCEDCTAAYQTRMLAAGRCINPRYRAGKRWPTKGTSFPS